VGASEAQVTQVAATLAQAQSNLALAAPDRARYDALSRTGDVSLQRAQQADAAFRSAEDAVNQQRAALAAAERSSAAAKGALELAQSTSYNAPIHHAQIVTLQQQQRQTEAQIAAANADVRQARAVQQQAEAGLNDLTVKAAGNGTVIARAVEPGTDAALGRRPQSHLLARLRT
jgi:multidrug resistance efflux pump